MMFIMLKNKLKQIPKNNFDLIYVKAKKDIYTK